MWNVVNRGNQEARAVADRHYNRQSHGSPFFVPPGACLVLYTRDSKGAAVWVTLIREAVELSRQVFGNLPLVTFIDSTKVKTAVIGYCYRKAGFKHVGFTIRDKLWVFQYG